MRFGKLTVLTARMNPDLAMAELLLKKTRTGNLFTVFGQPDIDIRPAAGGAGRPVAEAGDLQGAQLDGLASLFAPNHEGRWGSPVVPTFLPSVHQVNVGSRIGLVRLPYESCPRSAGPTSRQKGAWIRT